MWVKLTSSAFNGNLDQVKQVLEANPTIIDEKNSRGQTALYCAARNGCDDVVNYLIGQGANINDVDIGGSTALHAAAYHGKMAVVRTLLASGANKNAANNAGATAEDGAIKQKFRAVANYIKNYTPVPIPPPANQSGKGHNKSFIEHVIRRGLSFVWLYHRVIVTTLLASVVSALYSESQLKFVAGCLSNIIPSFQVSPITVFYLECCVLLIVVLCVLRYDYMMEAQSTPVSSTIMAIPPQYVAANQFWDMLPRGAGGCVTLADFRKYFVLQFDSLPTGPVMSEASWASFFRACDCDKDGLIDPVEVGIIVRRHGDFPECIFEMAGASAPPPTFR